MGVMRIALRASFSFDDASQRKTGSPTGCCDAIPQSLVFLSEVSKEQDHLANNMLVVEERGLLLNIAHS
jgi:hypothetical protein